MKKAGVKVLLGIAAVFVFVMVYNLAANPERRIFSMVRKNQAEYETAAMQMLENGDKTEIDGVESMMAFTGDCAMVQFSVTGKGIAPASIYYGFYYSPEDVPLSFQNVNRTLTEYADGAWEWKGGGDNKGRTKKIADCWYYYEASF